MRCRGELKSLRAQWCWWGQCVLVMHAIFSGICEYKSQPQLLEKLATLLAPVVQKVDSAIRWINLYPVDSAGMYVLRISLLLKTLLLVVVVVVRRLDQDILLSLRSSLSFLSIAHTEQYILLSERFTTLLLERYQNKKNFTVL